MIAQTRDTDFAEHINQIAEAIDWPDAAFTVSPCEAAVGVVVTLYEAFTTPDRALLQHARNGAS